MSIVAIPYKFLKTYLISKSVLIMQIIDQVRLNISVMKWSGVAVRMRFSCTLLTLWRQLFFFNITPFEAIVFQLLHIKLPVYGFVYYIPDDTVKQQYLWCNMLLIVRYISSSFGFCYPVTTGLVRFGCALPLSALSEKSNTHLSSGRPLV